MKSKMLPVAVALASLFAYSGAHANGNFPQYDTEISLANNAAFSFNSSTNTALNSNISVNGQLNVIGASQAVVDDKQLSHGNYVSNDNVHNSATVGSSVLNGASGNVGVNVAAGSNNQQANQTAISAAVTPAADNDAPAINITVQAADIHQTASATSTQKGDNVGVNTTDNSSAVTQTASITQNININRADDPAWGTASIATINVLQDNEANLNYDLNTRNSAQVGSHVLNGASGNIGVNVAAGSNNQQKNDTALSTGGNRVASAAITTGQQSFFNNLGGAFLPVGLSELDGCLPGLAPATAVNVVNTATVGSDVLNGASGNIGVNVAAGVGNQQVNSLAIASASTLR